MIPDQTSLFQGIENFRDFGGFSGRFGTVAQGRLFRCGHLGAATNADVAMLGELALGTIIDLRRPTERRQAPDRLPAGFAGQVIVNDEGDRREGPHIEFLRQGDLSDVSVEQFLLGYYRQALFEPRHRTLFARSFALLEATAGPMLVHCTAGKDRTGLLAALIHRVLGVHFDDVLADYLATNTHVTPARMADTRSALMSLTGREPSEAMLRGYLGVHAQHLEAAFREIDRRCGGLDAYLQGLGVDRERQDRVRARIVV